MTVDGRWPSVAAGVTLYELSLILKGLGCVVGGFSLFSSFLWHVLECFSSREGRRVQCRDVPCLFKSPSSF